MQKALSAYNESHEGEPLSAGIGLSWGTVIHTGDDVFGHAVNLAKRISDIAKGGQVLVTDALSTKRDDENAFLLRNLGEHDVKGLGAYTLHELVWREEVANLSLTDDSLNVVLTEDDKLVLEFAKPLEEKLALAQQKLLAEADSEDRGTVAALRRQVAKKLSKALPRWMDSYQARAGLGEEHDLSKVDASLSRGKLTIRLPSGKSLALDGKQVDLSQAKRFIEKLEILKRERTV